MSRSKAPSRVDTINIATLDHMKMNIVAQTVLCTVEVPQLQLVRQRSS